MQNSKYITTDLLAMKIPNIKRIMKIKLWSSFQQKKEQIV